MTDLSKIPAAELVDDYYASKLDKKACEKLAVAASKERREYMASRAEKNGQIMETIRQELERRGEEHLLGGK